MATQDSIHPVVIQHPDSGKQVLYVNPVFTTHFAGWTAEESAPLLSYLYQVASQPPNILRFKWQKDSIAFWDNRATWHSAMNDYPTERRVMHRITLAGSAIH
jgi:taurine dioxygenase